MILRNREIKCLGITWDQQGTFDRQRTRDTNKAEKRFEMLNGLMMSIDGPSNKKRMLLKLLNAVVQSIILHGLHI